MDYLVKDALNHDLERLKVTAEPDAVRILARMIDTIVNYGYSVDEARMIIFGAVILDRQLAEEVILDYMIDIDVEVMGKRFPGEE